MRLRKEEDVLSIKAGKNNIDNRKYNDLLIKDKIILMFKPVGTLIGKRRQKIQDSIFSLMQIQEKIS